MTVGFIYIVDQPEILRDCVKMGRTGDNETLKSRYTTYYPRCSIHTFPVNNMEAAEKFLFEVASNVRIFPEHELFRCSVEEAKSYCEKVVKIDSVVYNSKDDVDLISRYIEISGVSDHPLEQKITEYKSDNIEELDEHFIALNSKVYKLLECPKDTLSKLYSIKDNIVRRNCGNCRQYLRSTAFRKLRALQSDGLHDRCTECEKQKALE